MKKKVLYFRESIVNRKESIINRKESIIFEESIKVRYGAPYKCVMHLENVVKILDLAIDVFLNVLVCLVYPVSQGQQPN